MLPWFRIWPEVDETGRAERAEESYFTCAEFHFSVYILPLLTEGFIHFAHMNRPGYRTQTPDISGPPHSVHSSPFVSFYSPDLQLRSIPNGLTDQSDPSLPPRLLAVSTRRSEQN